jgi:hypothetical protein
LQAATNVRCLQAVTATYPKDMRGWSVKFSAPSCKYRFKNMWWTLAMGSGIRALTSLRRTHPQVSYLSSETMRETPNKHTTLQSYLPTNSFDEYPKIRRATAFITSITPKVFGSALTRTNARFSLLRSSFVAMPNTTGTSSCCCVLLDCSSSACKVLAGRSTECAAHYRWWDAARNRLDTHRFSNSQVLLRL